MKITHAKLRSIIREALAIHIFEAGIKIPFVSSWKKAGPHAKGKKGAAASSFSGGGGGGGGYGGFYDDYYYHGMDFKAGEDDDPGDVGDEDLDIMGTDGWGDDDGDFGDDGDDGDFGGDD